ncbi:MAG: tyrosine-type recombinase/integrase [Myxococcaceae bacterium]
MTAGRLASPLARDIDSFLTHKRALGCRYITEEATLRIFDRFLVQRRIRGVRGVTPGVIDAFLKSRPHLRPGSYNQFLGVLRVLFGWLVARRVLTRSPVQARPRRASHTRTPIILYPEHAKRLLELAGELSDDYGGELRGPTYRAIFAVLYALGLRVGEVCRLRLRDVDWDRRLLVIRESKFGKDRLVPFGPRLGALLTSYVEARRARHASLAADGPLFCLTHGHPLTRQTIGNIFRQLRPKLGIVLRDGASVPRVHDIRHSFALRTLLGWYREGLDPSQRLLHLSTFMGHVQPESTAVYLTVTGDLFHLASARFERLAEVLVPEVSP